jgi:hypothetical protein
MTALFVDYDTASYGEGKGGAYLFGYSSAALGSLWFKRIAQVGYEIILIKSEKSEFT